MKAITRVRFLILLVAVLSLPLISAASYARRSSVKNPARSAAAPAPAAAPAAREALPAVAPKVAGFQPLLAAMPFQAGESIEIYQSDCTTPATVFNIGQGVCAKVTGAPTGSRATQLLRRLVIAGPDGYIRSKISVPGNSATATLEFTIPATATSSVGEDTVDNRGTWQAASLTSEGSAVVLTSFKVNDPAEQVSQLVLSESASASEVAPGSNITFRGYLVNAGPNDAEDVVFTAAEPANTTFVSASAGTGSGFTCTTASGTTTCSADSLAPGITVAFTLSYDVSAPAGSYVVSNTSVATTTAQRSTRDNSTSVAVLVSTAAAPTTCNLTCPANVVATANTTVSGNNGAFVNFSSGSVSGDCGAVSNSPASGSFFAVGTHTVTASAPGDNGATGDSCTFTVKVVDTPAPTISCPANKVVVDTDGNGEATVPGGVGTPTFTASGGGTIKGVRSDSIPAVFDDDGNVVTPAQEIPLTDPYPVGVTGITWTVTDADGRTASCQQKVTVTSNTCGSDTEDPTITAPDDVTVGTGAANTGCTITLDDELGQPQVSDNCAVTVTITGGPAGNNFAPGTYTLTYTATDGAGNDASDTQVVTVIDDTAPIIAAPADATYTCPSEVPAANANQAKGPVIGPDGQFVRDAGGELVFSGPPFENCGPANVTVSETNNGGAGSASNPRVITRTFTATDAAGNSSSAVQTITVADPTPPSVALNGAASVTVECHTSFTDPGATASDNCGTATVAVSGSVNVNVPGTYTLTYTATDGAGNTASVQRTVSVVDTLPPTISCPADILVNFNPAVGGAVVTYSTPAGADSCAGALVATQTAGLPSGATFPLGTTTNTFTVNDGAGHTASCSFKVTVALTSIIGLDSISITGAGPVDSYDSNGGYPATQGSSASVVSNGTITMAGSARVKGSVLSTQAGVTMSGASQVTGNATAATTVAKSGSATVLGTTTNNSPAPAVVLAAVPSCAPYSTNSGLSGTYSYNAGTGNLSLSGVNVATLANGTYCFNNLSVSNSSQLKVNGPVTIKLTGTLSVGGAASLNNTTLIPGNLRILSSYTGSNGVSFSNSASAYLVVYAPQTGVTISGASPLFGTVAGKSLTISNSGMLHYDTRLQTVWADVWQLITGP